MGGGDTRYSSPWDRRREVTRLDPSPGASAAPKDNSLKMAPNSAIFFRTDVTKAMALLYTVLYRNILYTFIKSFSKPRSTQVEALGPRTPACGIQQFQQVSRHDNNT